MAGIYQLKTYKEGDDIHIIVSENEYIFIQRALKNYIKIRSQTRNRAAKRYVKKSESTNYKGSTKKPDFMLPDISEVPDNQPE